MGNSVMAPPVVIRPILSPAASVNHKAPSGPALISGGVAGAGWERAKPAPAPAVLPPRSFSPLIRDHHRAPPPPPVLPRGSPAPVGGVTSTQAPPGGPPTPKTTPITPLPRC